MLIDPDRDTTLIGYIAMAAIGTRKQVADSLRGNFVKGPAGQRIRACLVAMNVETASPAPLMRGAMAAHRVEPSNA